MDQMNPAALSFFLSAVFGIIFIGLTAYVLLTERSVGLVVMVALCTIFFLLLAISQDRRMDRDEQVILSTYQ